MIWGKGVQICIKYGLELLFILRPIGNTYKENIPLWLGKNPQEGQESPIIRHRKAYVIAKLGLSLARVNTYINIYQKNCLSLSLSLSLSLKSERKIPKICNLFKEHAQTLIKLTRSVSFLLKFNCFCLL